MKMSRNSKEKKILWNENGWNEKTTKRKWKEFFQMRINLKRTAEKSTNSVPKSHLIQSSQKKRKNNLYIYRFCVLFCFFFYFFFVLQNKETKRSKRETKKRFKVCNKFYREIGPGESAIAIMDFCNCWLNEPNHELDFFRPFPSLGVLIELFGVFSILITTCSLTRGGWSNNFVHAKSFDDVSVVMLSVFSVILSPPTINLLQ